MNNAKKKKPLRRAKHWGARVWPMAGRMAVILVAVAVMGLMFSALQVVSSIVLRDIISLAILSGILLMMYSEGLTRGVADADASHAADRLEKLGRPLTRKEESACYQPMKALCACLVVFAVPLALSLYLAATAKPYTYALQDLPAWLTGTYGAREDVMAPLAAYAQSAPNSDFFIVSFARKRGNRNRQFPSDFLNESVRKRFYLVVFLKIMRFLILKSRRGSPRHTPA